MTFRNLMKKALPFAVTALCSLVSLGAHEPAEPNENRPMMHDSLYDSWVATAYNALPDNPEIDPCLDGFYAPVYFGNLRSNFGTNRFGTCAFVAMGMLLSFYDAYWDDSIVPSAYEVYAISSGDPINGSIDSPGSCDSLPIIENSNIGYYLNTIVPQNDGVYLDMKLMTLASDYHVDFDADTTSETGLDYSGMYSLFQYYLYSYMGFSTSDIGFVAETGTGTGQARSESVRDFAIEKVSEGIPVLLSVGTDYSQITGRHAVIAYDYDEANDLLYCHMGWGPKATHVTIESFGYTSYNSAFSLAVRTQHSHSGKYRQVISGYCLSSHCACEFATPYGVKTVDWYRNEEPGFEWSCLNEERWTGDFIHYYLAFTGYDGADETTVEKIWKVPWNKKHGYNNTSIYDSQSVSVTVNAEYENDYESRYCTQKTASFPWITDFEGAHNVHPGDYAFSPNSPMQTGEIEHSIDGLSFTTNRIGVYEGRDMVSLVYAGSGFNAAYIQYYNFPQGDTVIGLDFGIRLWEGTNADHGLSIEYYDGGLWHESADLLESDYDIAGSNGAVRWVHHSFGAPVNAFRVLATSSGAGNNDYGVASLLTMAIYTVNDIVSPLSGSELPYLPYFWNEDTIIKNRSNCYRYAMNFPSFVDIQEYWFPGQFAQVNYTGATKEDLVNGALADSVAFINNSPYSNAYFAKIGRMETCPPGCYKVALLLQTNLMGWHWMRQNASGTWSQKNGPDDVTNLDGSSETILDPQFCDTSYNIFCGYYCVGPWTNYGMPSN